VRDNLFFPDSGGSFGCYIPRIYDIMKDMSDVISTDPEILGGTPVFRGTRVPIESLFDYLCGGETIEEFFDDFPTVKREEAVKLLTDLARQVSGELKAA